MYVIDKQVISDAPWQLTDEYLAKHKIDFVAHDELPYTADDCEDIYAHIKRLGMFVATERTEGIWLALYIVCSVILNWHWISGVSTSDILARIVKDYDLYVRRNLARGYSAKDLNVGFLVEKKFRFQNKMDELKDKGKKVMSDVKGDIITKWEEKSREFIEAFLLLFGRERLTNIWDKSKGRIMQALSPTGSPDGSINGDANDADDDFNTDDNDDGDVDDDGKVDNFIPAPTLMQHSLEQTESSEDERQSH